MNWISFIDKDACNLFEKMTFLMFSLESDCIVSCIYLVCYFQTDPRLKNTVQLQISYKINE